MNRNITRALNNMIDLWVPPIIRERRWFYKFLLKFVVKGDCDSYLEFRDNVWKMTDEDIQHFYGSVYSNIKRPTDCNIETIDEIIRRFTENCYKNIMEFGCGRGYLALKLTQTCDCIYTGIDFNTSTARGVISNSKHSFYDGTDTSMLPENQRFDCVIATHTLEHVIDLRDIFNALWDRTNKHLIIVVPLQLNLHYTPDLHTYFWRRPGDFFIAAGVKPEMNPEYKIFNGDLFVILSKPIK